MVTLKVLLEEVRSCTICAEHLPHGARPVLQAGSKARILIAGQAPGRRVHGSGVPFSPRNNIWLRRNPWFEEELLPVLQTRVQKILESK